MTVCLSRSDAIPAVGRWDRWLAVTGTPSSHPALAPEQRLANLPQRLEDAFVAGREVWWKLAGDMMRSPGGALTHVATCASMGSDFGLMLAWSILVEELEKEPEITLVVCDDPWLFRHLVDRSVKPACPAPPLAKPLWRGRLRGVLARFRTGFAVAVASHKTRRYRSNATAKASAILVYAHPTSRADGFDAYFSDLLQRVPELARLLHTDCSAERAAELCAGGRSASLHAWGHPLYALLCLPFILWRPGGVLLSGPYGWLIRRAAARENSGGGPAMNRWQIHCQERWLGTERPAAVAWPWENFAWERALVTSARRFGVHTVGYQHTVIGPHQFNYAVSANHDGLESVPERVIANGPVYGAELLAWGLPPDRLTDGGSFRITRPSGCAHNPDGPVFVPLSGVLEIAERQLDAARRIAETGRPVMVKEHPMYPMAIKESDRLQRTDEPMSAHDGLSAVVYTTGTSGLEAILLGIPAVRLLLADRISIDVLPSGVNSLRATRETIVDVIDDVVAAPPLSWTDLFSIPSMDDWRSFLKLPPEPSTFTGSEIESRALKAEESAVNGGREKRSSDGAH